MDFKQIGQFLADKAPLIGTLIGGPAGPLIGAMVASTLGTSATPDAIHAALTANPDAVLKVQQLENDKIIRLQELAADQAKAQLAAVQGNMSNVNTTMQTEAASDHWPTYSWRPILGMAVAFNTVAAGLAVIGVFIAQCWGAVAAPVAVAALPATLGALAGLNVTVLPVLGIASYFRGKMQADPNVPTDNRG